MQFVFVGCLWWWFCGLPVVVAACREREREREKM